mmetsp:Transcript_21975/g.34442  ORF Transcript_21975/g.34442 Transcript_21975/m.34442 type:complete len:508 (+) Transcript_21975:2-1525(+)
MSSDNLQPLVPGVTSCARCRWSLNLPDPEVQKARSCGHLTCKRCSILASAARTQAGDAENAEGWCGGKKCLINKRPRGRPKGSKTLAKPPILHQSASGEETGINSCSHCNKPCWGNPRSDFCQAFKCKHWVCTSCGEKLLKEDVGLQAMGVGLKGAALVMNCGGLNRCLLGDQYNVEPSNPPAHRQNVDSPNRSALGDQAHLMIPRQDSGPRLESRRYFRHGHEGVRLIETLMLQGVREPVIRWMKERKRKRKPHHPDPSVPQPLESEPPPPPPDCDPPHSPDPQSPQPSDPHTQSLDPQAPRSLELQPSEPPLDPQPLVASSEFADPEFQGLSVPQIVAMAFNNSGWNPENRFPLDAHLTDKAFPSPLGKELGDEEVAEKVLDLKARVLRAKKKWYQSGNTDGSTFPGFCVDSRGQFNADIYYLWQVEKSGVCPDLCDVLVWKPRPQTDPEAGSQDLHIGSWRAGKKRNRPEEEGNPHPSPLTAKPSAPQPQQPLSSMIPPCEPYC